MKNSEGNAVENRDFSGYEVQIYQVFIVLSLQLCIRMGELINFRIMRICRLRLTKLRRDYMSAKNPSLVRLQGIPGPKYFIEKANQYEVIARRVGANTFIEKGHVVNDAFSGSATVTKTYNTSIFDLGIVNDGTLDLTISKNAFSVITKPTNKVDDLFSPNKSITITATGALKSVVNE